MSFPSTGAWRIPSSPSSRGVPDEEARFAVLDVGVEVAVGLEHTEGPGYADGADDVEGEVLHLFGEVHGDGAGGGREVFAAQEVEEGGCTCRWWI